MCFEKCSQNQCNIDRHNIIIDRNFYQFLSKLFTHSRLPWPMSVNTFTNVCQPHDNIHENFDQCPWTLTFSVNILTMSMNSHTHTAISLQNQLCVEHLLCSWKCVLSWQRLWLEFRATFTHFIKHYFGDNIWSVL